MKGVAFDLKLLFRKVQQTLSQAKRLLDLKAYSLTKG
jgi:hypothetical protein